jgi:hypothetical protein
MLLDSLTTGIYVSVLFTSVSRAILDSDRLRRTSYTNIQAVRISCSSVSIRSSLLSSFYDLITTNLHLILL